MTEAPYDDNLISQADCENLWQQVLLQAVNDAVRGIKVSGDTAASRVRLIRQARDYIIKPNPDFNEVCSLAGMDPEAVRERVAPMIAAAPSPEELAGPEAPSRRSRRRNDPSRAKAQPVATPFGYSSELAFNGRTQTLTAWASDLGINRNTLRSRLNMGWPLGRAFAEPRHSVGRAMENAQ